MGRARLPLAEILAAFESAEIRVLVLKGAALAHILYPSVGMPPLSDIDLLVDARLGPRAQSTLAALGFDAPSSVTSRQTLSHRHLPAALRMSEDQPVQVEIHVDALSRDTPGSLSMDRLSGPPHEFVIEGRTARTLGHVDMLYHLYRHTAQRTSLLRPIWVADLVGYAARYGADIPWADVRLRYPGVINALSLLHLVTPLPIELLEHVTPARGDGLRGIGVSCKPFAEVVRRKRSVREIARDIFDPWWLRLYYGVGEGTSLWRHRWVTHPLRVGRWVMRRLVDYVAWRSR